MQRELIKTIGGILATGSVVFGCGLILAGTLMGASAHPSASEPGGEHESRPAKAKSEPEAHSASGHDLKKENSDEHSTAKKLNAHGALDSAEKPASHDDHASVEKPKAHGAAEKADSHGGHEPKEKTDGHAGYGAKTPPVILVDNTDELNQFALRFNDLSARGLHDDARVCALKAYALTGQKDLDWLCRLGDSTYLSETLPVQQRLSKAYEHYSALLAASNQKGHKPETFEWAQYRVSVCLREMGRWDDALEASQSYLKQYPDSKRRAELQLLLAQGLFVNGMRGKAREQIEQILESAPPPEVRSKALLELALIDAERVRVEPGDAAIEGIMRAEIVDLYSSEEELTGMPTARWQAIITAAEAGNLKEAKELLEPLIRPNGPLNAEQRARVSLNFAKLLHELPISESKH